MVDSMHLPPALAACLLMTTAGTALPAQDGAATTAGYIAEAPLAAGWPEPGVPGAISEALMPAHRAVEGPGFWPLFTHITAGGIPMTAPVVMSATAAGPSTMRFVFPRADTAPGPLVDGLRIVDAAPVRVLRIAHRGRMNEAVSAALIDRLRADAARRGLAVAGKPMLCGYNSPGIPRDRQTWEALLPVAGPATP
jgi:hypothetical protein